MNTDEYLTVLTYCMDAGLPAVVIAHFLTLVGDPTDENLAGAYVAWNQWGEQPSHEFIQAVNNLTDEGDCLLCNDCSEPAWEDDMTTVAGDEKVCDADCIGRYTECYSCDELVSETNTGSGEEYCDACFRDQFTFCDECQEHYHDNDDHDHDEDYGCQCDPPVPRFQFKANGKGHIEQNERLTVELPKGTIDDTGLGRIRELLYNQVVYNPDLMLYHSHVDAIVEAVGPLWQTKRGNFTRRLSSALNKSHKVKLTPEVISEIGNIGRAHSSEGATWHVEFTRDLNLPPDAFANDESCWWGSHASSRCALKNWGGMGLRTFDGGVVRRSEWPNGRIWVQPLNESMKPTHDALDAHGYVLFNGYGVLGGYTGARIVGYLTGKTYRRVELSTDYQYINSNVGYLVADEATCADTESLYFGFGAHDELDAHTFNLREAA